MRHHFMVKSEAENAMKAEARGLVMVVQVFCGGEEFAW
jgi:hypothetical protein